MKLISKKYLFEQKNTSRKAFIKFNDKNQFIECEFHGVSCKYNIEDWKFINMLSNEILAYHDEVIKDCGDADINDLVRKD